MKYLSKEDEQHVAEDYQGPPGASLRFAGARGSAAAELQPLVKELRTLSEGWRNSPSDPHNIANAVMVALLEVSNAIVRAYGEPPNDQAQAQPPERDVERK